MCEGSKGSLIRQVKTKGEKGRQGQQKEVTAIAVAILAGLRPRWGMPVDELLTSHCITNSGCKQMPWSIVATPAATVVVVIFVCVVIVWVFVIFVVSVLISSLFCRTGILCYSPLLFSSRCVCCDCGKYRQSRLEFGERRRGKESWRWKKESFKC